jgi:hypothetical protein
VDKGKRRRTSMPLEVKEAPSLILPPIPHLQLAPFPVEACARIAVQRILRNKQKSKHHELNMMTVTTVTEHVTRERQGEIFRASLRFRVYIFACAHGIVAHAYSEALRVFQDSLSHTALRV